MTPEERSMLERTYKFSEENNDMLRSIRRSNRFSTVMRFVYWGVILALSFGAYYFIQPYMTTLLNVSGGTGNTVQSLVNSVNNAQSAANGLKDLLK